MSGVRRVRPSQDDPLRLQVRQRQRRIVALVLHGEGPVVHGHDGFPGPRDHGFQGSGQVE